MEPFRLPCWSGHKVFICSLQSQKSRSHSSLALCPLKATSSCYVFWGIWLLNWNIQCISMVLSLGYNKCILLTYIHFPLRQTDVLSVHCINAHTVFRASLKGLRSCFLAWYRNRFKAKDNIHVLIQHIVDLLIDKLNTLALSTVHRGHVNYSVCLMHKKDGRTSRLAVTQLALSFNTLCSIHLRG